MRSSWQMVDKGVAGVEKDCQENRRVAGPVERALHQLVGEPRLLGRSVGGEVVRRELGRSEQCAPDEAGSDISSSSQRLSDGNRPHVTTPSRFDPGV